MLMKNKIISLEQAASLIKDGDVVMIGGFMTNGTPKKIIDAVVKSGVKNLTIICNDAGYPDEGSGRLLRSKQAKKLIATHIGLNPEAGAMMSSGELEVELIPQGTFAERMRCAGAGLGGFLTPTGIGTEIEKGKQVINVEGKDYLLELPLRADVALLKGSVVDKMGNIFYKGTTKNFNMVMATAAKTVIVEAEELVEVGELDPEQINTPSIYVDYIVGGNK